MLQNTKSTRNTVNTAKPVKRKRRQDCRHAVYAIENILTGQQYIGITVCAGRGLTVAKALRIRLQKHVRRAVTEAKAWSLCASIRQYGEEAFVITPLDVVKGRKAAHAYERELIRLQQPELNVA